VVAAMRFRLSSMGWLAAGLLLAVLLAACGGDKSSDSSDSTGDNTGATPVGSAPVEGAADANSQGQAIQPSPTGEPLAAVVNGQPILLADFERERMRRAMGLEIPAASADAFDADVLQAMIDQVLIEQAANALGIVVTDAEIDAEIAAQQSIVSQNGQTLEEVVQAQGYTMDEYRAVQYNMLLSLKVSQTVADISPMAAQVHSRHILVADEATARDLIARIQAGEDFAQLAAQYTLDGSTRPLGGDLDWVSEGDLLQIEVEKVIFALQPGQLYPEPVHSSLGYHVIQVLERVEDRPLTQAALAAKKQQAFVGWLEQQRQTAQITRYIGTEN